MLTTVALQIAVGLLCMTAAAFFSGIETGVISIHRLRLRHFVKLRQRAARILQDFLDEPDRLLGTVLIGTNLSVVTASVVATSVAIHLMGPWGEAVASVLTTVVLLIFCEYLPKAWFHVRPYERCARFAELLLLADIVMRPLSRAIIWLSRWLLPGPAASLTDADPFLSKDELKTLAGQGEQAGTITARERSMIHRVFDLSSKRAADIMVPRQKIQQVEPETPLAEFFEIARRSGLTRLPVHDRRTEKYVGIVNVFNAVSAGRDATGKTVAGYMRPPMFIPDSMPVGAILPRVRRFKQPMCLVTNAQNQVVGLLTTDDVLQEIVGKL